MNLNTPAPALLYGFVNETTAGGAAPVWVRDEWSISARAVREEAQSASVDSPLVFILLPRQQADALKAALVAHAAATETLAGRPAPATDEAIVARRAMQTHNEIEEQRLEALVAAILTAAQVYQGGGGGQPGAPLSPVQPG